jgi:hypothetical protein
MDWLASLSGGGRWTGLQDDLDARFEPYVVWLQTSRTRWVRAVMVDGFVIAGAEAANSGITRISMNPLIKTTLSEYRKMMARTRAESAASETDVIFEQPSPCPPEARATEDAREKPMNGELLGAMHMQVTRDHDQRIMVSFRQFHRIQSLNDHGVAYILRYGAHSIMHNNRRRFVVTSLSILQFLGVRYELANMPAHLTTQLLARRNPDPSEAQELRISIWNKIDKQPGLLYTGIDADVCESDQT